MADGGARANDEPACDPAAAALMALVAADPARVGPAAIALDDAGWRRLADAAFRHGVAPLAWSRLRERGLADALPAAAAHDLARSHFRSGIDNLRLYQRLAGVLRRLDSAGIGAVVLKGAYLAEAVYRDRALRWMSDADLLLRHADLGRAGALLVGEGWRQAGSSAPAADDHGLPTFEHGGVRLDVHWNLEGDGPIAVDVEGLWARARPTTIGGAPALALAPEDLLLHLCLHTAYNHGWLPFAGGLRHLCDIAEALRRFGGALDWRAAARRASDWRASRCVALALAVARDLAGAQLPADAARRLDLAHIAPALLHTAQQLALGAHYAELTATLPVLSRCWLRKNWSDRPPTARARAMLWPPTASLAAAYPSLAARGRYALAHAAHLRDLARDLVRALAADGRRLRAREHDRGALLRWLESEPALPAFGVRQATPDDCAAAATVNARSWRESFAGLRPQAVLDGIDVAQRAAELRRRFDAAGHRMFVAEAPGHGVIGFADLGRPRERCEQAAELYAIYVLREFQGRSVGTRLFGATVEAALAAGRSSLRLVALHDSPYRAFYERLGGRVVEARAADPASGQDASVVYAWADLRALRERLRAGADGGAAAPHQFAEGGDVGSAWTSLRSNAG